VERHPRCAAVVQVVVQAVPPPAATVTSRH
jgi:hypothetical protein